ncbi:MAG: thioredoxin [Ignavibacterium sp.]|nr:MAG: thioredoxin [Ignavibacterium sp.]
MSYEVQDFQKDVLEKSHQVPVLVDFWAEWCGPCKVLSPVLEKLAKESNGNWALAKIDTDKNQELAAKYGIRGIPNCKLFSKGEVINEFTGALPEQAVKEWLKKSIPSKFADSIEKAKQLLRDGNEADAKVILEEVLQGDMNNDEVKILLAKVLLFEEPKEAIRLLQNSDGTGEYHELADALKTIMALLDRTDKLPNGDVMNEYSNAIEDLTNKNFDASLEKFIDVIREDRHYDDDGSRKACIAIFKYLGEEHPTTIKRRREFGSALYV